MTAGRSPMQSLTSVPPRQWDIVLAALGAGALIVDGLAEAHGGLAPGAYALAIAAAMPLAWRTRAPLPALAGVEAGALGCAATFDAGNAATALIIIELYTVARLGHRQRSIVIGAVTALIVAAAIVLIDGSFDIGGIAIRLPLVFAALACGDLVRARVALRAVAQERAEHEAHQREQDALRRAADERLLVARELHDTLAHSLVAINVRAGVALDLHDSQDPHAALADVKEVSAHALTDLRATLGLLRRPDASAPTEPLIGLDALPTLIDRARSAGLRTDLTCATDGITIPTAVTAAAYRIVQESLTNVLRHANASAARVCVQAHSDRLEIEIVDDGRSDTTGATHGLGLRGITERTTALGGHVTIGPRQDGGWRVQAVLPLRANGVG